MIPFAFIAAASFISNLTHEQMAHGGRARHIHALFLLLRWSLCIDNSPMGVKWVYLNDTIKKYNNQQ